MTSKDYEEVINDFLSTFGLMQKELGYTLPEILKMTYDEFSMFLASLNAEDTPRKPVVEKTTIDKAFPFLFG